MKTWKFREMKWLDQGYAGSKWWARIWTQTFEARHSGLSLRLRVTAYADDYWSVVLGSKKQELLGLLWRVYFYRSLFESRKDYILSSGLILLNLLFFREKLKIQIEHHPNFWMLTTVLVWVFVPNSSFLFHSRLTRPHPLPCNSRASQ